jgi:tetratricopeptide (TPR) repeat protein
LGRFDEAWAAIQKITDIDPTFSYGFSYAAYKKWGVDGRLDLAAEWFFSQLASDENNETSLTGLAQLYSNLGDDQTAWCWMDSALKFFPDAAYTIPVRAELYALRGDDVAASEFGRRTPPNVYGRGVWGIPMAITKGFALQSGRTAEMRSFYLTYYPEFRNIDVLELNHANFFSAVDYAHVLIAKGDSERAEKLLLLVESYLPEVPRLGVYGHMVSDVRIHALRGNSDLALAALKTAVDEGWRYEWRFFFEIDSILEPLRSEPAFEAILAVITRDMDEQLQKVRASETLETTCNAI